ncbi:MAG TPA: helicase HerA-like domain-containing protein [Thermodesulfobacteriota bacterium]|nr:helicase HerA-like domain-containing protein [Thermodesulfobacteriota bacterium]
MAEKLSALTIAKAKSEIGILPKMANRHGLIAGATGTGKTVTLRVMAEQFSSIGVPVFMADVKGDLSGLPFPGGDNPKVAERIKTLGLGNFGFEGFPTVFWDVFGEQGHPVRATISEMGPLLLSRILSLNDIQSGVLNIVFKIADDNRLLLLDLKDLRAMVQYVGDNADQFKTQYGNISTASIGAIQRGLLTLGEQGGEKFFGEPALNFQDLMQMDGAGKGVINIIAADRLMQAPRLYATFLLWMLSELFEHMPEVGDPPKPNLVFFFDEAHLLFTDLPKVLEEKIEQVVRLIRSKGIGIYFITQNPLDIPDTVLGQLGNRVQHALRAFTPRDQKDVKAAADTFRPNPKLNVSKVITELEVGEALVSVLDEKGSPTKVERAMILPPKSRLTPLAPAERAKIIQGSTLYGHYEKAVDRESAFEMLKTRAEKKAEAGEAPAPSRRTAAQRSPVEDIAKAVAKSAAHAIGSQIGRQIIRGVLGSLFGGKGR